MPGLTPAQLLDTWERAMAVVPAARPAVLLAASEPGRDPQAWADVALGRRDAHLSSLRTTLAGPAVEATANCPGCGEQVEIAFDADQVWSGDVDPPASVTVTVGSYQVACRCPTTADLIAATGSEHPELVLLSRCVVTARCGGETVTAGDLPAEIRRAIEAAVGEADPQADPVFALDCPACSAAWSAPLDLAAFVWDEFDRTARRTLAEVDVLARAYGWREPDVLALSSWRRHCYLGLAQG